MAHLEVDGLGVTAPGGAQLVRDVSYQLGEGKTLAIVGESGSGKSASALALLGLLPTTCEIRGRASYGGVDLLSLTSSALRRIRGSEIGIVFQDPLSSLHPTLSVGAQLRSAMSAHSRSTRHDVRARALSLLEQMGLPDPLACLRSYPHQLSGGQRQRVLIAIALAQRPRLLIADEPTTALDSVVQADILTLLQEAKDDFGLSLLLISHDLGVVGSLADDVAVAYAGRFLEIGPARQVLEHPEHPYTQALLRAQPKLRSSPTLPVGLAGRPPRVTAVIHGCAFAPRCELAQPDHELQRPALTEVSSGHRVACLLPRAQRRLPEAAPGDPGSSRTAGGLVLETSGVSKALGGFALHDVSLTVSAGEFVALLGPSGSGKSTLSRIMVGLITPTAGRVRIAGQDVSRLSRVERAALVQLVFQDPAASLNPRRTVADSVTDPLRAHHSGQSVGELLTTVGLDPSLARRRPAELSGGERQRVAIARAIASRPKVLILDEPLTSLDVSVQALVLRLLRDLQDSSELAILLIAHDLAVVANVADRVVVMAEGRVVESGTTAAVIDNPASSVTQNLIAAVPAQLR